MSATYPLRLTYSISNSPYYIAPSLSVKHGAPANSLLFRAGRAYFYIRQAKLMFIPSSTFSSTPILSTKTDNDFPIVPAKMRDLGDEKVGPADQVGLFSRRGPGLKECENMLNRRSDCRRDASHSCFLGQIDMKRAGVRPGFGPAGTTIYARCPACLKSLLTCSPCSYILSFVPQLLFSSSNFLRYSFSRRVASRSKTWYLMQTRR